MTTDPKPLHERLREWADSWPREWEYAKMLREAASALEEQAATERQLSDLVQTLDARCAQYEEQAAARPIPTATDFETWWDDCGFAKDPEITKAAHDLAHDAWLTVADKWSHAAAQGEQPLNQAVAWVRLAAMAEPQLGYYKSAYALEFGDHDLYARPQVLDGEKAE